MFEASRRPIILLLFAALAAAAPTPQIDRNGTIALVFASALADDDDDGGDDDDDGGGFRGSGGSSSGPAPSFRSFPFPWFGRERPRRAVRRAAPPPQAAAREIVALGLTEAEAETLRGEGFEVIEERALAFGPLRRLRIPDGTPADEAEARVAALNPAAAVDANHFYRPDAAEACAAQICPVWSAIGWPGAEGQSCPHAPRIGLIDTGINPDHAVFEGRRIELLGGRRTGAKESGRKHGTAVAALLVGAPGSRTPGLLPDAHLIAVDPFERAGRADERADAFALVAALDTLLGREVAVVNMSLSGPANAVLERAVTAAAERGVPIVASVGNGGTRSAARYPAAYDAAIAVTAVDRRGRIWRRAVQGDFVDFAAPGVSIPTAASVRGVRPQTGTSFAAPFVTAAVAVLASTSGKNGIGAIVSRLSSSAIDLGKVGRDPVFGFGLLSADGLCGAAAETEGETLVD